MNTDVAPVVGLSYYFPPRDWFWHWQEHGRVIAWHDGPTIAFRDELETVLRHLLPQGWPPLGALVLLLAACRDNWQETPGRAIGLTNLLTGRGGAPPDFTALRSLCDGLDRVHALPEELRRSLPARAALAELVFETAKECTTNTVAAELLNAWPQWRSDDVQHSLRRPSLAQFRHEMFALLGGLAKVDERTLRLRMQTGLDVLPEPAPIQPKQAESARALIDQLVDDPELCGVAYIARQLLSVVLLPRPVSNPADMPEGGVSDISNRGPLDRLLLSELAHDDTTLAVRVALNEALYYRRETPPSPPPRTRKLLLDAGVRMWGVPRVFAAAVGLALAAAPEKKLITTAFRASGRFLDDVDLQTRDGLIAHLAALETAAHPGEALAEFCNELEDDAAAAEGVLISCDEVLADPEFQRELARSQFDLLYIATVSRSGRYRLIARSRRGVKVLREATLDLDKLLAAGPRQSKLIDRSLVPLPAIFGVEPFPLFLSVPLAVDRSWHVGDAGVLTYTRDGRLLHWVNPGRGATQLAEGLPQGRLLACEKLTDTKTLAVVGKLGPNGMWAVQIDVIQREVTWNRLQFPHVPQMPIAIYRGRVLLRHEGNIIVMDGLTGELVSQATLASGHEQIGRIVQQSDGHGYVALALGFDGVPVWSTPPTSSFMPPLAAFETDGIEGIVIVKRDGNVVIDSPQGKRQINVNHGLSSPLNLWGVSRDGRRFVLCGGGTTGEPVTYVLVTIKGERILPGSVRSVNRYTAPFFLEPYLAQYVRPRTLRSQFMGICVTGDGELALISRKRSAWPIQLDRKGNNLRLAKTPHPQAFNFLRLREDPHHTRGYSLKTCQFSDGTLVWLDGRGMLHLRSSDPAIPEATIVLCEGSVAGWLSDGRVWGPNYFHSQVPAVNFTDVYDHVLRPMIERMTH